MATWDLSQTSHHVLICNGGSCSRKDADAVTLAIREEITAHGADDRIHTTRTQCNGRCEDACVVTVYPQGVWYKEITPDIGKAIVREHLIGGNPLTSRAVYGYADGVFTPTGHGAPGVLKTEAARRKAKQ